MSPDRLLLSSGEGGLEPQSPNMVLSSIPVESSHINIQEQTIAQAQPQPQQTSVATNKTIQPKLIAAIKGSHNTHQQLVRIASPAGSAAAATVSATSLKLATIASTMPSSKLLVLQSNDGGASTASTSYLNGQDGSKIVLMTTEQMVGAIDQHQNGAATVSSSSTNDEELTSLTWLHDKNLLKGKRAEPELPSSVCAHCAFSTIRMAHCSSLVLSFARHQFILRIECEAHQ